MPSLPILRRLNLSPRLSPFALWFFALILIAFSALPISARAQINLGLSSSKTSTSAAVVQTPRVRAEIVAQTPDGIAAGQTFWLGLKLAHEPDWHTYWKNAGDSGLPTELQWQLPAGLNAGAIDWPTPHALRVGPLVNYGYENTVLLPIPVKVASDFKAPESGMVEVRLSASWLICRVECIPESGEFALQIPVGGTTAT
ncbi:MAG: protein-disulfide reductase DsbD family protein, partial [Comamonas sp.]